MSITPIYEHGTWGEVVALDVNGVTIRPTDRGPIIQELREVTFERLDALPLTMSLNLAFEGLSLWKRLEHNGELPDLTPIPEPEELRLAREKRLATDRLESSFNDWAMAGWETGLGFRVPLEWSSPILQQLRETAATYQQLVTLGMKQLTDVVPVLDISGSVQQVPAGVLLAKAAELTLIRQTAVESFTLGKSEIENLSTIQAAQDWQPPAWE